MAKRHTGPGIAAQPTGITEVTSDDRWTSGGGLSGGSRCAERGCPFPPIKPGPGSTPGADGWCSEHTPPASNGGYRWRAPCPAVRLTPAERAAAELLRNPGRSNRAIGLAAEVSYITVRRIRLELESAGEIDAYRDSSGPAWTRVKDSPGQVARAMLRADASQSGGVIAAAADCTAATVLRIRHELEAAGEISVYRRGIRRQDRA